MKSFIVKIQQSITTSHQHRQFLLYNESRTVQFQGDVDKRMAKLMGKALKKFFHAHMEGTEVMIDGPAPEQSW